MLKRLAVLRTLSIVGHHAAAHATPDAEARAALAPTGTLRAGMNLANTLFTTRDPASGALRGVGPDLMRELASRLGVPLELVVHATPGQVADAVDRDTWDVAILAIEPSRATQIAFSPPLTEIEATYLVPNVSTLRSAEHADTQGVRIVAAEKTGYELYLARTLRHATLVRARNADASIERFNAGGADALAGLRPMLMDDLARTPGARLLDGKFMTVNHGLGVPRSRHPAGAAWLKAAVDELGASGFIAQTIERHGVRGLAAAG